MGTEFLENLWGWQITRPDLVSNWAWDEVKAVYFDDKQKLGLPQFLGQGHNAHVKAHMLAIFMVAAAPAGTQAAQPNATVNPKNEPKTESAASSAAEAAPRYYELTESAAPASDPVGRTLNLLGLLAASLALFTLGLWRGRQTA